jgi:hypothetical protein
MRLRSFAFSLCLLAGVSCAPDVNDGPDPVAGDDDDGDHITNGDEGSADRTDTDGDGTPDFEDLDSDDDGIPDDREGGDDDLGTNPVDTDEDGTPDFRDTDSDDNGRADGVDGFGDVDGDGHADYADTDDDGDQIDDVDELGPNPANGIDTDDDNIPDFQDTDSDADTIPDITETDADYDQDGTPNFQDLDSDEDCVLDFHEAGGSPPIDSDDDGRYDFLDRDSDGDGLGDGSEDMNCNGIQDAGETDPLNEDSDGDGVTDLVEDAAGTDPNNGNDNPQAHGDFFFVIPYEEPTAPLQDTLHFRTSVQFADLYFSFDITGSMGAEMTAMANATTGVPAIINQLKCPVIGGACNIDDDCASGAICFNNQCVQDPIVGAGCIPDLWTGVGHWYDLNTFKNTLSVQSNAATTASNISQGLAGGSEVPFQAAQCVADGVGCTSTMKNCAATGLGCPGFRHDTVRILVQITDADNQCLGASCSSYTAATAGAALISRGIKFIGLYGTDDDSSGNPETPATTAASIGVASGTVDTSGNPFVYSAIDSAVVTQTKQAVLDIVKGLPLDVTIAASEVAGDDGDAVRFIDYLEVNTSGGSCTDSPSVDGNGDGRNDMFPDLIPGTRVCWDVVPIAENTIAPATEEPQLFIARLKVAGDGSTLDTRDVFFLIPPVPLDVPVD